MQEKLLSKVKAIDFSIFGDLFGKTSGSFDKEKESWAETAV
jgi:hypothetical protein